MKYTLLELLIVLLSSQRVLTKKTNPSYHANSTCLIKHAAWLHTVPITTKRNVIPHNDI